MLWKYRKPMIIILIVVLLVSKYVFRKKDNSFFTEMIDNSENNMVSLEQNDRVRELLEKHQPIIYVHKDSYKPLDFYKRLLPETVLKKSGYFDRTVEKNVTDELLDKYARKPLYYLDYQVDYRESLKSEPETVPIYGRAYKSMFMDKELIFLKYNVVFPYSGLPEDIAWWKTVGSHIMGTPKAWHELDIHGAIHIALYDEKPVALILAQHNHHRTYLIDDEPVEIAFAKYSNEPYLIGESRLERTVGNPLDMSFLIGLDDQIPLTGGYDYIPSKEESFKIEGYIQMLPLDDPLYRATMSLGDRHKILGIFNTFYMEGPPGMDYYTMPDLLDLSNLMAFWYINPDETYHEVYNSLSLSFENYDITPLLELQKERMYNKLFK